MSEGPRLLVVDASVVVDLIARFQPEPIEALLWDKEAVLVAPELMLVEALQALRRLELNREIPGETAGFPEILALLPITTYRHQAFLLQIWNDRKNLTAYDAVYVALARTLGATLVTRDEKLASAPGLDVEVEVL